MQHLRRQSGGVKGAQQERQTIIEHMMGKISSINELLREQSPSEAAAPKSGEVPEFLRQAEAQKRVGRG